MKLTRKGKLNSSCIPRRFWVTVASTALYFPSKFLRSRPKIINTNIILFSSIKLFISFLYITYFFHQEIIAMQWNLLFILCFKINYILLDSKTKYRKVSKKREFFVRLSLTCTPSFCLATFTYLASSGIFSSTFIHRR